MIEVTGDLWTFGGDGPIVRCITTNGMVKADGSCVMGRGCAKEAATRWPTLPKLLGAHIKENGNVVAEFIKHTDALSLKPEYHLASFPVKHKWMDEADPDLILQSANSLSTRAVNSNGLTFLLPRPGCGNGRLKWADVKPLLSILPGNVLIIDRPSSDDSADQLPFYSTTPPSRRAGKP